VPPGVSPAPEAVERVATVLAGARRPLLVAGGGARGAAAEVRALADRGIPVLTTVNGKGVLDESHPHALGAGARLAEAHRAMNAADVVLLVGTEIGDSDLWGGSVEPGRPGERVVVRVDIDPAQMHKNVRADLPLVGDARLVLAALLEATPGVLGSRDGHRSERLRSAIDAEADQAGKPWAAIQSALSQALPADVVVAGDSSQVTYYGTVHSWRFTPANRLLYPTGYATLGYGIPAAVGAKVAQPERPVIALVGDGAAMFSIQELMTAVEQRLPLPVVVVDNGGYAEIREQMVERDIEPQGVDLREPDFPALARAMGAHGVASTSEDELAALAAAALRADRPTLIHHRVQPS
jgi:acetolactate synthase-1/2/3 large subunit